VFLRRIQRFHTHLAYLDRDFVILPLPFGFCPQRQVIVNPVNAHARVTAWLGKNMLALCKKLPDQFVGLLERQALAADSTSLPCFP
jgi:hypothetical protein